MMKPATVIKESFRTLARKFAPALWTTWHKVITSRWQMNSPFGKAPKTIQSSIARYFQDHSGEGAVLMERGAVPQANPIPICGCKRVEDAYARLPPFEGIRVLFYQLKQAKVFGGYGGMVVTRSGRIFEESSPYPWGTQCHPALRRLRWPGPPVVLKGKTAYLATPEAANNYYHFLIDCLPKLELLRQSGFRLDEFDHFIINSRTAYSKEILSSAGIPKEKILFLGPDGNFAIEDLYVPEFRGSHNGVEDWQVEGIRRILGPFVTTQKPTRKLYAARGNAKFRKVLNEDAVISELTRIGFEIIDCGALAVTEQVERFSQAALVVAPHGAALTNLAFCPPGAVVIEMVHPKVINGFYRNISRAASLRHHVLAGQGGATANLAKHRANGADFSIDIKMLLNYVLNHQL